MKLTDVPIADHLRALPGRVKLGIAGIFVLLLAGIGGLWTNSNGQTESQDTELSSQARRPPGLFHPTQAQWAALTVEPVQQRVFRSEHVTEGKIAVDEDHSTPIFSPYAGRVTKLLAKPGDLVGRGQPLFTVEATDMVQAQNDFMAAAAALNKARSQLELAQIVDKRQRDLYEGKAVPLKDVQQARAALDAAENDARSAEVALEATRNRLRILGKSDQEITEFKEKGTINPETPIYAPISGTIVQRKVGPGQYVSVGASDPIFVIGDMSNVWLVAFVREIDAPAVRVGEAIHFTVLAFPTETFSAEIGYVATAVDPTTRRLLVRATIDNAKGLLKPEMFASVTIATSEDHIALAVARDAVILDGETARVWIADDDNGIELRRIRIGQSDGDFLEVREGLEASDRVIVKGSLFIDRAASAS